MATTSRPTSRPTKIVTFGCWNEHCCDVYSPMYKVINAISEKDNDANYFFILGDNIYPQKTKNASGEKEKIILDGQLHDGIDLLKKKLLLKKSSQLYLLLGNHDIEQITHDTKMTEKNCTTLINERDLSRLNGFNFPNNLTMFQELDTNTLAIMIDTTIYTDDSLDCYRELGHDPLNLSRQQEEIIKSEMEKKMSERKGGEKYKNIIICGHHPLIGFKNLVVKEGEIKKGVKKPDGIKGGVDTHEIGIYLLLLDVIRPYGNNFFYLCADIHNYQEGNIIMSNGRDSMTIKQHIVGIGGAHLDKDYNGKYIDKQDRDDFLKTTPPPNSAQIEVFLNSQPIDYTKPANVFIIDKDKQINLNYTIGEHFSDYGYLVSEIMNNEVTFRAVNLHIDSPIPSSSGGKRTKKRRSKKGKKSKQKNKKTKKINKKKYGGNQEKSYDFSKIHPASIFI